MSLPGNQQAPLSAPADELAGLKFLATQQAEQIGLLRRENNMLSRHLFDAMERIATLEEQLNPKPARAGYETVTADADWAYLLAGIEAADEDPLLAMVGAPVERWTELCPIDAALPFARMCERYGLGAVVEACRCAGWGRLEQIWSERRAA